jgi:acetyl esterase/lipase
MTWHDLVGALWPAADNHRRRRNEVRAHEDLAYVDAPLPKQHLDLFVPQGDGPFPLAVFLHGGLWKTQDRKLFRWLTGLYANVGVALAEAGVAVAVPSVRQDLYAHTEHDALAAIAWLRAQARTWALDVDRLSLMGHSGGGALALSLAWDPEGRAGPVCAAVSMCGVYDLARLLAAEPPMLDRRAAQRYFASDEAMAAASPERRLRANVTPALLVTATGDAPLLREEHAALLRRAREVGARVTEHTLTDTGHMGAVLEVGRRRDRVTPAVASLMLSRSLTVGLDDVPDAHAWLRGLMRPKRPALDAARGAIEGARTGDEAWRALDGRGLVPTSWRAPSTRCFAGFVACHACRGAGSGDHGGPCLSCHRSKIERTTARETPPSIAAALSLASLGTETLVALEGAAMRFAVALVPWGFSPPTRVCWCVTDARAWRRGEHQGVEPARHADDACEAIGRGDASLVRAFERNFDLGALEAEPGVGDAIVDLEQSVAWGVAVREGLAVPLARGAAPGVKAVGALFRSLPDPFEPCRVAWSLGCALDRVERDGTVVLVVPA